MNNQAVKNRISTFELNLYRFLGVRSFRKLILKIECIKHSKDKSRNLNYHLKNKEISSAKCFVGYLLYNTTCHSLSLLVSILYYVLTCVLEIRYLIFDLIIVVITITNLYCIMLQRHTYIKLHNYIEKCTAVRKRRIAAEARSLAGTITKKGIKEIVEEYEWIQNFHKHIQEGEDVLIEQKDVSVIDRISIIASGILKEKSYREKYDSCEETLFQVFSLIPQRPQVIEKVEQHSSLLQKIFHLGRDSNTLFGFCIVTENVECERAFRMIFSDNSRDSVEYVIDVLLEAYKECIC